MKYHVDRTVTYTVKSFKILRFEHFLHLFQPFTQLYQTKLTYLARKLQSCSFTNYRDIWHESFFDSGIENGNF